MIKKIVFKTIVPLLLIGVLLLLFTPICSTDGKMDYFLLWILVGLPFGLRKMCFWLMPKNFGIAGSIGVIGFNCIIGGLIGGFIAVIIVVKAFVNLVTAFTRRNYITE